MFSYTIEPVDGILRDVERPEMAKQLLLGLGEDFHELLAVRHTGGARRGGGEVRRVGVMKKVRDGEEEEMKKREKNQHDQLLRFYHF